MQGLGPVDYPDRISAAIFVGAILDDRVGGCSHGMARLIGDVGRITDRTGSCFVSVPAPELSGCDSGSHRIEYERMKGFTHFISGVAIASCFPEAVIAASAGNPLYFILGGFGGILPDTIDFKFVRFLYRVDIEVQPDPSGFDAQMVADGIGMSIREASVRNRPIRLKLNTVRVGADAWQQYRIDFDVIERCIQVQEGPIVNTGQQPIRPARGDSKGRVSVEPELCLDYEAIVMVDIFDGPIFQMTRPPRSGVI